MHFAAWFLVGTPFALMFSFLLKPGHAWLPAEANKMQAFCVTFLVILCVSLALAWIDVFLVGRIVHRFHRASRK